MAGIVVGGDILEITFSDEVLGSGFFSPLKGEDNTFVPGGFENDDNGAVDGAGRLVLTSNRNVGSLQVVLTNDMSIGEVEIAKALQSSQRQQTWTISHSNGNIYRGQGAIVGSLELNTNKATFQMKIVSGLGFEKQ